MKFVWLSLPLLTLMAGCTPEPADRTVVEPQPIAVETPAPVEVAPPENDPFTPVPGVVLTPEQQAAVDMYRPIEMKVVSELRIGVRRKVSGTDHAIEFKQVLFDSRCPDGAACVGSRRLEAEVELTSKGKSERVKLTGEPVVWGDLTLVMRDVVPHPSEQPQAVLPRLQLIVDKAGAQYKTSEIPGVVPDDNVPAPTITGAPQSHAPVVSREQVKAPTPPVSR